MRLRKVVRVEVVEDAVSDHLFGTVAQHSLDGGADVAYGAFGIDDRDDVGGSAWVLLLAPIVEGSSVEVFPQLAQSALEDLAYASLGQLECFADLL